MFYVIDFAHGPFQRQVFFLLCQQKLFDRHGATSVEWHQDPPGWRRVSALCQCDSCCTDREHSCSDISLLFTPLRRIYTWHLWWTRYTHSSTVLGEWPSVLFAPQGLYCEHGRSDSRLQTCVGAGYVVSNKQPLVPQRLSKNNFASWHTTINLLINTCATLAAAVRQVEAVLIHSATCWHEGACAKNCTDPLTDC